MLINDIEIRNKEQLVIYLKHAADSANKIGEDFIYKVLLAIFDMHEGEQKNSDTDTA